MKRRLELELITIWWFTGTKAGCMAVMDTLEEMIVEHDVGSREYCALKTLGKVAFYKAQAFTLNENQIAWAGEL